MRGEILCRWHDLVGIAEDGEEVDLGQLEGSILPIVAVGEELITLECGDGTRLTVRQEDVAILD